LGFLRRLLGGGQQQPDRRSGWSPEQRPGWMREGMEVQLYDGREDLEVVGEASYQDNLWRVVGGGGSSNDRVRVEVSAVLVAETDNPYDANAVSVWVQGLRVGYLSREDARRYRPGSPRSTSSRRWWSPRLRISAPSCAGCRPGSRSPSVPRCGTGRPSRWSTA
jgi:hypothetical protein